MNLRNARIFHKSWKQIKTIIHTIKYSSRGERFTLRQNQFDRNCLVYVCNSHQDDKSRGVLFNYTLLAVKQGLWHHKDFFFFFFTISFLLRVILHEISAVWFWSFPHSSVLEAVTPTPSSLLEPNPSLGSLGILVEGLIEH